MRTDAVVRRTERWFVHQGVPQLITGYRLRTHVLPRMLPFLLAVVVVCLVGATLPRTGSGVGAVVVAVALALGLLALPWLLAGLGRRLPRVSRNAVPLVLVLYALTPVVVPLLLIGAYGRADRALVIGAPGASTALTALATGFVLAVGLLAILAVSWFTTAYGLVPLAGRAVRHAVSDMRGSLQLQGRALPTLLFVTFFLFFTNELWQMMNHLSWFRLVLVLALFAAVTVLATSVRLRAEVDRVQEDLSPDRLAAACAGTPLAAEGPLTVPTPPALTPRQETNLLLVLATRQLIQAAVVGLGLFGFFLLLGWIVVDHTTAVAWIGAEPQRSAWVPFVPVALLRAAALLAGFASMYFAITTMTQEDYRREFFEPVISDVERTLAVRAVYLSLGSRSASGPTARRRTAEDQATSSANASRTD